MPRRHGPATLAFAVLVVCAGCAPAATATPPPPSAAPTPAASLEAVRDAMLAAGTCDDACLADLRALWAADPASAAVRDTLTGALIQRRDWSGLAAVLEALAAPTDADRMLLAKAWMRLGRFDDAGALLDGLAEADPADPERAYNAAYAAYYRGEHARAAALLDGAWARLTAARDANALTLRALVHLDAGETARALAILEPVVADEPSYFPAWNLIGRAHAAAGDAEAATAAFDRVAAIHAANEADTARRLRLSAEAKALQAAWRDGRLAEAERLVDAMLPVADPGLVRQLHEYAAAIYEATGRPTEAAAARAAAAGLPLDEEGP